MLLEIHAYGVRMSGIDVLWDGLQLLPVLPFLIFYFLFYNCRVLLCSGMASSSSRFDIFLLLLFKKNIVYTGMASSSSRFGLCV
jgi:hypothetical protein